MKFLGIDLGWLSGASGLCCLEWTQGQLQIRDLDRKDAITDILTWIDSWVQPKEAAIIAIDAPTLIPNTTGMRLPDKFAHKYFGKYHAGCYPANLNRPFAQRTVDFGLALEARSFTHAPVITPKQPGRYQIEVFPHPAIVHLFNLERILKYKKGKLAERHIELMKLYQYIVNILPTLEPALKLDEEGIRSRGAGERGNSGSPLGIRGQGGEGERGEDLSFCLLPSAFCLKGTALKAIEDQLDSLICAYVAAHWWYWGLERNWVLGDRTTGYIVVPARLPIQSVDSNSIGVSCPEN